MSALPAYMQENNCVYMQPKINKCYVAATAAVILKLPVNNMVLRSVECSARAAAFNVPKPRDSTVQRRLDNQSFDDSLFERPLSEESLS